MADVTVIILTFNEEIHLPHCLDSLRAFTKKVVVVDSYSTDRTVELAIAAGAAVFQHKFLNQAKQFQWALDTIEIETGWVMRLDADEIVYPSLAKEIVERLDVLPPTVAGINLNRRHIFLDRWIKFGGRYPLPLLRLWRKGRATIEDKWMDEHILVTSGDIITFSNPFADYNRKGLSHFVEKHNKYATREAVDVLNRKYGFWDALPSGRLGSRQARRKRWIKEVLFSRAPFGLAALGYFLYRYIVQLGFLDGKEGLAYHFLQGWWYRFLVEAKRLELERGITSGDKKLAMEQLCALTGLNLMDNDTESAK